MKNRLFTTTCFSLILLFTFCNGQKQGNGSLVSINIEANMKKMEVINLSKFTDNIRYVPLDNTNNLLIGATVEPAFSQNLILVNGINSCLLFDNEGHFITNIGKKGRGPGEYQYGDIIGFSKDKNVFIKNLFDLFEYEINGSFIKKYTRSFLINNEYYLYTVFLVNDSLFLGHVHNSKGQSKYKALLVNKYGNVKRYYNNYILFNREREVVSGFEGHADIYKFKNEVYYKEFYNDTLFSLSDQYQLNPRFAFNLGKFKEPVSERAKIPLTDMMRYLYIWNAFQTEKYLFLKCQLGYHFPAKRLTPKPPMMAGGKPGLYNTINALGIYNKKTGELVFSKPTDTDNPLYTSGLYNDIDGGPRFFPNKMVNDSTMMMYINVKELKDHVASDDFKNNTPKYPDKKRKLEKLATSLSVFDNPVLMLVTFKK